MQDVPTIAVDAPLSALEFDNVFTRELPADAEEGPKRRQVAGACYSRVQPTPVAAPTLVAYSDDVARMLGLDPQVCTSERFAEVFTGNRVLPGMDPHATCYGGHQFGNWAGQLGDGRAINLGELLNAQGERFMLQLKGAGLTPYSRTADGLAVLRSSVREFLCSEAMHHLGVPTTRALSLTLTGEQVMRDMFYDGNAALEPGAVVCRVAPSFLRFGHFEILAARKEHALLARLADHAIDHYFPGVRAEQGPARYAAWFRAVADLTRTMIVGWMRVGFVHGVMNTDNMSILGLTIDYGPYGWLDDYDPDWTPNTTDAGQRRYRYGQQPAVALWNLVRFAEAIYPLVGDAKPLESVLQSFESDYLGDWAQMMAAKLGLPAFDPSQDAALVEDLDGVLRSLETDMTRFYRLLAQLEPDATDLAWLEALRPAFYQPDAMVGDVRAGWLDWLQRYRARTTEVNAWSGRRARMDAVNPHFVLRNYLAQLAIDAAEQGNFAPVRRLLDVLRDPYTERPEDSDLAELRPDWARTRPGCSQLSCSS